MNKISIAMPMVTSCGVGNCGYNVNNNCHAKAITIGDSTSPGCDTFMKSPVHSREMKRIAGVGACKVGGCKFNQDFECVAASISVGPTGERIQCLSFAPKSD